MNNNMPMCTEHGTPRLRSECAYCAPEEWPVDRVKAWRAGDVEISPDGELIIGGEIMPREETANVRALMTSEGIAAWEARLLDEQGIRPTRDALSRYGMTR